MRSRVRVRRAWARPVLRAVVVLAALGCRGEEPPPRLLDQGGEPASADVWLEAFPVVDGHPHLERAGQVLARMRESVGVWADLHVLEMGPTPRALALPDDTVFLSASGLDLCYDGVPPESGDARLAFLFGHELTHVANDDFWHAEAFAALRGLEDEGEALARLHELLEQDGKGRQTLELKADDAGLLAVIQAGYDPAPLLHGDRSFFEEWTGGAEGSLAYGDATHPTPADRAEFLRRRLAEVAGKVDLFDRGVAALREAEALAAGGGGRELLPVVEASYREAVEHFERFRLRFPGREVLSDLALAHLRLAALDLAACDGTLVNRYYLPTVLDPVTLAERAVHRGPGERSSPCLEDDGYRRPMDAATRLLREAVERDPGYLPARLNLVAAFVLDEQPAQAANLARETLERFPEAGSAAAAWSAGHLAYLDTGATLFDPELVLARIGELRRRFPGEPGIAFNLASGLSRRGRPEEAEPVWRAFLELEPDGPWAKIAWEWVGEEGQGEGVPSARS